MSYKGEVVADNSGKWVSNAVCFATKEEAEVYVADLGLRWTAVRDVRVVESNEPVNYVLVAGELKHLETPTTVQ